MKNLLRKTLFVFVELGLVAGALWFIAEKRGIHNFSQLTPALQRRIRQVAPEKTFPQLRQPVSKTFAWNYKGVKYELPLTLYRSVYEYYQNQPKTYSYEGQLPADWEEDYYGMFLKADDNDPTIAELASRLKALGQKHDLNNDQIVELSLSFVQAIQYDDTKASNILAKTGNEKMLYPYETLFEQKGVCSDKSLLEFSILRQLGYGVAIFAYEQDNHMAIGVQCPKSYSTYGSGYCYAETTSVGNKIGIIPQFDVKSSKAADFQEISAFDQDQWQQRNLQELGQVTIYQSTLGKEYAGIIETKKTLVEIAELKNKMKTLMAQLGNQKNLINQELSDLKNQKDRLESLKNKQSVEKYNDNVEKYNALVEKYKQDVKKYNDTVALYNQAVARYNILIKQ